METIEIKITFYPNGHKHSETPLLPDGRIHGFSRMWFDGGQLFFEDEYKNGLRDGKSLMFFYDGTKCSEINYSKGRRHGEYKIWNKNGSFHDDAFFRH